MTRDSTNLLSLPQPSMERFFSDMGEKPYRAAQVMKWIYHHGIMDPEGMTNLSKALRHHLAGITRFQLPEVVSEQISGDGVCKWLLRVDDDNCIETVFIPEQDRGTLCISSQVGCALNCRFCSTGKQGFNRNLGIAEIIGQLWLANERLGYFKDRQNRIITNVVMMGMGEPLLNFDNVLGAISLMTDDLGFNLSNKRVTLSTAGIVPGIDRLASVSKISLAVSLHAPDNGLRDILVPINRHYPIEKLLPACKRYSDATGGDPITFEYVMLKGINDKPEQARRLAAILRGIPAKINLIPFNTFPDSGYTRSPQATIDQFRDILINSGLITITRKTRGDDISAACGQLAGQILPRAKRLQQNATLNQA